ncbi:uncharacterized protein F54H12.2-like [Saccostrea echinata]|uniref:uncharacterized protein F54H12.2-like n=1 Tax=Saccostrea echinata TaxID=191078 RepID=UPI002A83DDE8|nr:uncharacterized protein F54H12.2-like [Saccostrea echinata]
MLQPDSCACGMNNLQLFQVPPTNIALEDSKWEEYYPISSTLNSDTAPIEFEIKGQGDQYLDLSQTYVQMVCKFTKEDGGDLTGANTTCAPVNNILHSLFTEIDLSVNGKIVSPGTDTYPYKAYLEKLLSYKPRTLMTQMRACSLWEKDTAGHMDEVGVADLGVAQNKTFDVTPGSGGGADTVTIDEPIVPELPANSRNEGFRKRHQAIKDSKKIALFDRLHLDLFQQDRFLPNGVDVRLRFNRARPQFYMMIKALSTGKVKILNMVLWVRKVKPTAVMMNGINQNLNTHRAKYPLRRVEVKTFTILTGTQSKITDHLFQGQMPKRLILGFVENAAFNGDKTKNPFHFQNFGIKKLDVSINGETMSTRCFEPNFNEDLYLRSYLSLYQALGKLGEDWAPDITLEEYKNGYTLWGWDFTKDQEAQSDKFHIIETGNLRIEVQFTNNTVNTLNCVVYAEFDNLLEINKQREVSIDY